MEKLGEIIVSYAERNGIGFPQVIIGLAVLVFVWRLPELLKYLGEFVNERRRIMNDTRFKQEQTDRRIAAARKRRAKEGQAR